MKISALAILIILSSIYLFSCTGKRPSGLGVKEGLLSPCPSSPNCVSSDAGDSNHHIAPFMIAMAPDKAWLAVNEFVSGLPRTQIVTESSKYLHAECRSLLFGFVDDLELHLRPAEGVIAVRSASRLGYSDFGVNRSRIEELRESLIKRGTLK